MDGILIIDKPAGLTSHDVVARVRRLSGERRIGHTGTLDPFATGVLVLLCGRATRLAQFLSGAEKEYEATIRFGYATDTGDLTGRPLGAALVEKTTAACERWGAAQVEGALVTLRGPIEQVPPMYSAKKIKGRKLYELARRGEEVERAPVAVNVHEFEAVHDEGGALFRPNVDGTCDMRARVVCSAGTYVRALAETLGERLGAGAHLAGLRRTRAGAFRIDGAVTLENFGELSAAGEAKKILLPMEAALSGMPFLHLTGDEVSRTRHGAPVRVLTDNSSEWRDGEHVRMRDGDGRLIAVGVFSRAGGHIRPRVLLAEK